MSGEPKTLTPERFQHRHPVEAIRFTGANASDIYKFVGWEVPGDRVRLDNKAGVMRLWTAPPIHVGDWLVRRPQPLHKSEAACRPRRYVVYTDVDFHATFEPVGVPVVARDEAAELRAENAQLRADLREYIEDGFLQGAHRQEDGGYSTGGISTYRDLGDWLVEHAGWTRREGGVGRMQVYDPPRRLAGGENER